MLKLIAGGDFVDTDSQRQFADTELASGHSPVPRIPSMLPAHGGFPDPEAASVFEMIQQRQRRKQDRLAAAESTKRSIDMRNAAAMARQDGFERGLAAGAKRAKHDASFWFGLGVLVALVALVVLINVTGRHL